MAKQNFQGTVVSNKMLRTVLVAVKTTKLHPKYKKRYTVVKKYMADCGDLHLIVGNTVSIESCRPISKNKKWKVIV